MADPVSKAERLSGDGAASGRVDRTDPIVLAASRGREEFAAGLGLDSCPYPDDGPERAAWINAWCDAEEKSNL